MPNGNGPRENAAPLAEEVSINIKPPKECSACKTSAKLIDAAEQKWTIWRFDMFGIFIFICPFCHGLTANTNVHETVDWANAQRDRRVAPVKSPLIIPPGTMPH